MIEADRILVSDEAAILFNPAGQDTTSGASVVLIPITASAPIYLGGEGVTADDGARWDPALGPLTLAVAAGEKLYAVTDSADPDQEVHSLATGK